MRPTALRGIRATGHTLSNVESQVFTHYNFGSTLCHGHIYHISPFTYHISHYIRSYLLHSQVIANTKALNSEHATSGVEKNDRGGIGPLLLHVIKMNGQYLRRTIFKTSNGVTY